MAFKLVCLVVVLTKSFSPYSYPPPSSLSSSLTIPRKVLEQLKEKNKKVECVAVPSCLCAREGQAMHANEERRDRRGEKRGMGLKAGALCP